jgi:hypothetical protein
MNIFQQIIIILLIIIKTFLSKKHSNETRLYSCFDLVTKITKDIEKEKINIKLKTVMAFSCYCLATEKDINKILANSKEKNAGFSTDRLLEITNPDLLKEKFNDNQLKKLEKEFFQVRQKLSGQKPNKKSPKKKLEIPGLSERKEKIKKLFNLYLKIYLKKFLVYFIMFIIFFVCIFISIYLIYKRYKNKQIKEKKN